MTELKYFDHTATKLMSDEVIEFYQHCLRVHNYNPAARYKVAHELSKKIEASKKDIASYLGADSRQLIFTSGGTESINTVLCTLPYRTGIRHKRILITSGEHSATKQAADFLAKKHGYEVMVVGLDASGRVDLTELRSLLSCEKQFDLFSYIVVNNQLGSVNDCVQMKRICQELQPHMLLHGDAVQVPTKIDFSFQRSGLDFASFSCHKFGAPKGCGFLLTQKPEKLPALIMGGGQQNALRAGTENPALVFTIAKALQVATTDLVKKRQQITSLQEQFYRELNAKTEQGQLNFVRISDDKAVPHINVVAFPQLRAETLLNCLSAENICVSIGSACSSKSTEQNVLYKQFLAQSSLKNIDQHVLRISLAETNTAEEVHELVESISRAIKRFAR